MASGESIPSWSFADWVRHFSPRLKEKLEEKELTSFYNIETLGLETGMNMKRLKEFLEITDMDAMVLKRGLGEIVNVNPNHPMYAAPVSLFTSTLGQGYAGVGGTDTQPPDPAQPLSTLMDQDNDSNALLQMLQQRQFQKNFDPERIQASLAIYGVLGKLDLDRLDGQKDYVQRQRELLAIVQAQPSLTRPLAKICVSSGCFPDAGNFMLNYLDQRDSRIRTQVTQRFTTIESQVHDSFKALTATQTHLLVTKDQIQGREKIGSGAFCDVFRVRIRGKVFAEKVPKLQLTNPVSAQLSYRQFVQEIFLLTLGGLEHTNIIQVTGVCIDSTPWRLILEYMPEGSLTDFLIKRRPSFSIPTLIGFCRQIADACEYLHGKGCIHLDIATRNVLCKDERTVKLADFGGSKNISSSQQYTVPFGEARTLPLPHPPEDQFGYPADAWFFGVFIWEIFYIHFSKFRADDVTKAKVQKPPYPFPQEVPNELKKLTNSCWKTDPDERPSFVEIVVALSKPPSGENLQEEGSSNSVRLKPWTGYDSPN